MEKKKVSKKALRTLLNDSIREAIGRLELPSPTKKVKKLIDKSSKNLAAEFAVLVKKELKKAKKSEESLTYVEDVLTGKSGGKKAKKSRMKTIEAA